MKKELFNEILKLTKLQTMALEDDHIDEFISLMEKKQTCINQVNEIINNNPATLDDEDRTILCEIVKSDKRNKEEFDRQFEEVQLQLRKIRHLKKRDMAYVNPQDFSFGEGIFIDKK